MTNAELLEACRALAPDFRMRRVRGRFYTLVAGECTFQGRELEFSMCVDPGMDTPTVERTILRTCLDDLRYRSEAA